MVFWDVDDMEDAEERLYALINETRMLEMLGCSVMWRTKRTLKRCCFTSKNLAVSEFGPLQ
jgi:hypothetical protein